ncbi:hypothetical protein [Spiroplasma floricola]|uniref:Uncharacterized protein n=1 Tax=Spiroplasma floricola 23-6 TaxID=1336749 RepID=A0A2K8SEH9_9MOLU|nr:hypothetical protein [Spiroplasma floricola]AUB31856.1 hypothetical protein SFLOR_v1c08080 [Spiroplasma floricola 23-6]
MINIGPWWLFDIMAFSIIIGCTVWGIKRGFLATFYLLLLQVIALIILMFVPALLTNALNPTFMKLWVKSGFVDVFSSLGVTLGNFISGLLPGSTNLPIDGSGTGYEILKVISALGIYVFFSIFIFIFVNIIGLIFYRAFKRKMSKVKIIGSVDTLIGAFNGLALGMTLSMSVSFMASFPLFQTENQRIGLMDYSNMTEEQIKDKVLNGSAYKKYSLARKISSPMPAIPIFGFTYTNSCITKYVLDPLMVISSQLIADKSTDNLKDFFVVYEDLLAKGYSTTNPLETPVSTCIEVMPKDSRSLFRLTTEMMLMGTAIFVNDTTTTKTEVTSVQLINALDKYYLSTNHDKEKLHEGWLNESEMINFYKWVSESPNTQQDTRVNPFIKLADNIDEKWKATGKTTQRHMSTVLRDPKLTYNFFKSLNYVNATTRNNLDTMPYLSTIYTANYLIDGLEIVPSGELKLGEFYGIDALPSRLANFATRATFETKNNVEDIEPEQQKWWKDNYKNSYWIQYYFDFAKGYFN